MGFDYKDTFQVTGALYTIHIVGFICAKFKVFSPDDLWPLFEVTSLCYYPGLLFLMIGQNKLDIDTWKPFFPVAITQLFFHIVSIIVAYFTKKDNFYISYLKAVTSIGFQEYTVYAFVFIQVIVGDKMRILSVFYLIAENFIYLPILKILIFLLDRATDAVSDVETPNEENHIEEDSLEEHDGVVQEEIDDLGNPKAKVTSTDNAENENPNKGKEEEEEEEKDERPTFKSTLIKAWVKPSTVLIIVGLIWSATGASIPDILVNLTTDLSKCVTGVTLFVMGGLCATVDFKQFNVWVVLALAARYIVGPLLVGGLSRAFDLPSLTRKLLVLASCAPVSLTAAKAMGDSDETLAQRSMFFWSVALYLPAAFIWGAILIETNLF